MAAMNLAENLKADLTCPVCLGYYTDPVIARCGHTFCRECLSRDWLEKEGRNSCPLCRTVNEFGDYLRSNRGLEKVITLAKLLRPHLLQSTRGLTICVQHGKEESLFCEEDQRLLCESCLSSTEHREHRVLSLEKAAEPCMEKLHETVKVLREKQEEFQNELHSEKHRKVRCIEKNLLYKDLVVWEYRNMHSFLRKKKGWHLQRLDQEATSMLARSEQRQVRLFEQIVHLRISTGEAYRKVEAPPREGFKDKMYILWNNLMEKKARLENELNCVREKETQIQRNYQALREKVISEYMKKQLALVEEETVTVEALKKERNHNLRLFVRSLKRMSQHIRNLEMVLAEAEGHLDMPLVEILQHGKGTLERSEKLLLQDLEMAYPIWTKCPIPVLLETLMTFHSDLTLDPETAHSHLVVSDNLKSVNYVKRVFQDLPEAHQCVFFHGSVLASQGFTSGKHYWEIEVGDLWVVGICSKPNNKQEAGQLPWIVRNLIGNCYKNDFAIDKSPCIHASHKAGIFLDYENGCVTIYEVTDRIPMYCTTDLEFDGAVYPCFSPFFVYPEDTTHGSLTICPRNEKAVGVSYSLRHSLSNNL